MFASSLLALVLAVKGCTVVDGTGAPGYPADVAVLAQPYGRLVTS